ncbi:MAG: biotin/lipoyl-binding protein [Anaerolineaceae bacterium]|nr:biotin/lipoyl-binding protein [Anaerolineaceae bacterium]
MRYTYQHNGQTYTLNLEQQPDGQYVVTIGDRTIPVNIQSISNGGWRLSLNGQSHIVYTAKQGDQRFVQVDGASYTLTVPGTKSTRRATQTGEADLVAQMPGQVIALLVQAGEETTRGQTLMILEAMKMEIRVTAPADGQVKAVLVQQGTVVERGQRLVVFESTNSSA